MFHIRVTTDQYTMDTRTAMARMLSIVIVTALYLTDTCQQVLATDTRVVTTAPVNPVVAGEILSLHCQVWSVQKGQDITLYRTPVQGESERIAVIVKGEALIASNSGTVFVAVRQMSDGSVVHFLSILNAGKLDEGEYACKIESVAETDEILPRDSVNINVAYFPSNPPLCSLSDLNYDVSEPVMAGTVISMSCDAEEAYPSVDLEWSRSGSSEEVIRSEKLTRSGRVTAMLLLKTHSSDSGKIFTCRMSSVGFPGRVQSCHIGPLNIIPNHNEPRTNTDNIHHSGITNSPFGSDTQPGDGLNTNDKSHTSDVDIKLRCWKTCNVDSAVMYWILATVTAATLAFIFLILGIIMAVKYYRVPPQGVISRTNYMPTLQAGEEIYVEVESKRSDKSMYMSLEKPKRLEPRNYPTTGDM